MRSMLNVRLAEARMTKRELERRTGLGHTTVWHYATDGSDGIGSARMATLEKIARAIGCSVKDLFEE